MVLDLGVPAPPALITIFGLIAVLGDLSVLHHLEDIGFANRPELDAVIIDSAQEKKVPGVLGLDVVPHEIAVGVQPAGLLLAQLLCTVRENCQEIVP